MNVRELERKIKESIVNTGLRKIHTIERRKRGEILDIAGHTEYMDLVNKEGCSRIEWKRVPVTDDQTLVHEPTDVAALCQFCGATIHRDNLVRCIECGAALCNAHRHRGSGQEYVCSQHILSWLFRKILRIDL
jgi:hypothetical protein